MTAGGTGTSDLSPHTLPGREVMAGGAADWPGLLGPQSRYLDSLLMTRMRAPFSSFSLWLSDFSSVNTCG